MLRYESGNETIFMSRAKLSTAGAIKASSDNDFKAFKMWSSFTKTFEQNQSPDRKLYSPTIIIRHIHSFSIMAEKCMRDKSARGDLWSKLSLAPFTIVTIWCFNPSRWKFSIIFLSACDVIKKKFRDFKGFIIIWKNFIMHMCVACWSARKKNNFNLISLLEAIETRRCRWSWGLNFIIIFVENNFYKVDWSSCRR